MTMKGDQKEIENGSLKINLENLSKTHKNQEATIDFSSIKTKSKHMVRDLILGYENSH